MRLRRVQGHGLDFLATAALATVTTLALISTSLVAVLGGEGLHATTTDGERPHPFAVGPFCIPCPRSD